MNHENPCALRVDINPQCRELLVKLVGTGLFGETIQDAVEQLVRERLIQALAQLGDAGLLRYDYEVKIPS